MTHATQTIRRFTFLLGSLFVGTVFLGFITLVSAQSDAAIAQGFQTDDTSNMVAGALVSLKSDNSQSVELATSASVNRLIGVVDKNPLVTLSNKNTEVQIVTNGITSILVSDINGRVRAGDKLTASPVAGVSMLATTSTQIIGTAQANFSSDKSVEQTVTDKDKKSHTIRLAQIPIQVSIGFYQQPTSTLLPPFLQNLANNIAGRPVALMRILLCAVLLLAALVSIVVLLYTSTRASITSIGRNPLAAAAIRKGLMQVGGVTVLILVFSLLASYLALTV